MHIYKSTEVKVTPALKTSPLPGANDRLKTVFIQTMSKPLITHSLRVFYCETMMHFIVSRLWMCAWGHQNWKHMLWTQLMTDRRSCVNKLKQNSSGARRERSFELKHNGVTTNDGTYLIVKIWSDRGAKELPIPIIQPSTLPPQLELFLYLQKIHGSRGSRVNYLWLFFPHSFSFKIRCTEQ